MDSRGEATRLAAAKIIVTIIATFVIAATIFGLAGIFVKWLGDRTYRPQSLHNTFVCMAIFVSCLLTRRWLRISLQRSMIFFSLFNIILVGVVVVVEYYKHTNAGEYYDLSSAPVVPYLGVLLTALIAGRRAAVISAAVGVSYLGLIAYIMPDLAGGIGVHIIIVLALPCTAVLVEKLLDEVEREAHRARLAETSLDIMTHDLGNPLAVLSASLEMLEDPELLSEQKDTLMRAIRRNTNTLSHLLKEFQDICRLDEPAPMEKVDLHTIAYDVIELYARPMCEKRGLALNTDLQPVQAIGAPSRLGRVVRELLTNAIKYTPRGGTIEVTLEANSQAILRVSDDGWGIKEEELPHIFEQNWRGTAASQGGSTGRGLGLFICKSIVENHGGHIEVESQENQGCTFTVYLPLPSEAEALTAHKGEHG